MYKRKRKTKFFKITKPASIMLLILLCVSGFFIPYIGFFLYAMDDFNKVAYNLQPPDETTFIAANYSRLHAMAMWFE
ncbi:MAG: hypothetical protein ACTSUE_18710, partial [Promethearchaeota archaeon]